MWKNHLPGFIHLISKRLLDKGVKAYLVGGCVRDISLGKAPLDWDIVVDCNLRELKGLFPGQPSFGFKDLVHSLIVSGYKIEFTTLRGKDLLEDLSKRDFTMNALAYDLQEDRLYDPSGGISDLQRGILKAVGSPKERFIEDPLRMLRAIRFVSEFGLKVDKNTLIEIVQGKERLKGVAVERVRDEIKKTLLGLHPYKALWLFVSTGLSKILLPEIESLKGIRQSLPHRHRLLKHTLLSVLFTPPSISLRLSALLHDIGKPAVISIEKGRYRFFKHHTVGEQMTREILKRLRFPLDLTEVVSSLVRNHLFFYSPSWSDRAIKRFIRRVSPASIWEVLAIRRADLYAHGGHMPEISGLRDFAERIEGIIGEDPKKAPKLAIDGNQLMTFLKIPPGPLVGKLLRLLEERVSEDPEENTPQKLLRAAKEIYGQLK